MRWIDAVDELREVARNSSTRREVAERMSEYMDRRVTVEACTRAIRRLRGEGVQIESLAEMMGQVETDDRAATDTYRLPKEPKRKNYSLGFPTSERPTPEMSLVIPDTHHPVQDQRSIDAVLAFARDVRPDHVVQLGDCVDFFGLSTHHKEAEKVLGHVFTLQDEAESAHDFWDSLVEIAPLVDYIPGNHEFRLQRFIDLNPALHGNPSFDLENVLDLPEGVELHPYKGRLCIENTVFEHGDNLSGTLTPYGAAKVLRNYPGQSTFYGHTHRIDVRRNTVYHNGQPKTFMAASLGHLSDLSKQSWVADPNWQQGCALIEWHPDGDTVHVIEILDHSFGFGGRRYDGKKTQ